MPEEAKEVKPWDLLNPKKERSSDEIAQERFAICQTCPAFRPRTQTCSKCGCFMKLKTLLAAAYCPVGRW